jgi:alkylation response protein AidB-like acyl-CoA dehydrogenase
MAASLENSGKELYGLDSESRQMVIDMIGQLKKRLLVPEKITEWDKKEIFPEDTLRELLGPDIGLQLLMIPEAYGGMGGGARDSCDITREMSKICLGITTAFFALQLGADPLVVGGTEAQKAKWLGKISEGRALVAYAVTEPDAGSNVAAIKTKADPVKNEAGEITGYRITGNKQFISTGAAADFITLLAKTPEGPTFFVIEKDTEGFTPGRSEEKHGIRASQTSALAFTDVFVPVENLIGGVPGKGMRQANQVFGYTRLMVASMGLGAGEAALDIVIPYAKERVVSGSPLSEKQGYTHKLVVPHAVRLEVAAAYIYEVAHRLDSGEKDLQIEGSIAKFFSTEIADKAASDAMQALGGYGYISEFGVEKIKRDVKIACVYEGTSEVQQNIISTFRWKNTIKSKGKFYESMAAEIEKLGETAGDIGCRSYSLAARILNETIMLVHQNKLTRKQYVMFALADMMTHVEVGACMARKAAAVEQTGDPAAEKFKIYSRIFANEVAQVVAQNVIKIVIGIGIFDKNAVAEFLDRTSYNELLDCYRDVINDMDKAADYLFER